MAGHSQFKNIMHRKGRQDAQRAKIFTKLIREITTAARLGAADPNANPRLRAAMIAARENNMTRDTIDRAIKRGSGSDAEANYEEVRYEGAAEAMPSPEAVGVFSAPPMVKLPTLWPSR